MIGGGGMKGICKNSSHSSNAQTFSDRNLQRNWTWKICDDPKKQLIKQKPKVIIDSKSALL